MKAQRGHRGRRISDADRLAIYVTRTENCWLWTGPVTSQGYGQFARDDDGRQRLAHRVAFEAWVERIEPADLTVDHICAVKLCVRPDHLRLLTREEHGRVDERRRITRSGGGRYPKAATTTKETGT